MKIVAAKKHRFKRDGKWIHTCTVCGKEDAWGDGWEWFGSYKNIDDGRPVKKTCSDSCRRGLQSMWDECPKGPQP